MLLCKTEKGTYSNKQIWLDQNKLEKKPKSLELLHL